MTTVFVVGIGDVVAMCAFAVFIGVWLVVSGIDAIKQFRCKHDGGVSETSRCHALCRKCGKDLGFIGNYRKKLAKEKGGA